jgi:hypothetical protein
MLIEFEQALDPLFIWMFRFPLPPLAAFGVGLTLLALAVTIVGELAMAGAYFLNRKHFAKINREMILNNNNSIRALSHGDKVSYKACNSLANDAFGRNFFSGLALFASSIWPVAFALGWLALRYGSVEFPLPLVERTVGANFFFVPLYIVVRVAFCKAKPWLPVFRTIRAAVLANQDPGERMLSWADLLAPQQGKRQG